MIFLQSYQQRSSQGGQAMLVAVIFFTALSVSVMFGVSTPVLRQTKSAEHFLNSRQSILAAESSLEDVVYRFKEGKKVTATESLFVGGAFATTSIVDIGNSEKALEVVGDSLNRIRKLSASLTITGGTSFNYGVQSGLGGFILENSATINGSVYSSGSITGANSNLVKGEVVSAGPSGVVNGIHATSSVYAHTIQNSTVGGNAYYQTISNTTVTGTSYPGSADQPALDLPIPDSRVSEWETEAVNGGTITTPCPYKITGNTTLGPVKINCDLEISNNPVITLAGPVWVKGTITVKNSPTIKVLSSLGSKTVPFIADDPSNRTTSSKISLDNTAIFEGSGSQGSYVLMLSQNNSAEIGGDEKAINVANGAEGALLVYAGHGEVLLQNSVSLREVTAYRVRAKNSAEVVYESGLANLLFTSGPAGSWTVASWGESE